MTKVIVDDSLRSRLNGLNADLEFCDESGQPLGHFIPNEMYWQLLYAWAREQFADDEELNRARQEMDAQGGFTTAEVLAYLNNLPRPQPS